MTTSRDAGDDLLRILDELDQLITSARSMPMSASAIVNRDDALALIDSARHSVPTAVRRAEEIVADADDVLAQGREESERIVLHAQEEALGLQDLGELGDVLLVRLDGLAHAERTTDDGRSRRGEVAHQGLALRAGPELKVLRKIEVTAHERAEGDGHALLAAGDLDGVSGEGGDGPALAGEDVQDRCLGLIDRCVDDEDSFSHSWMLGASLLFLHIAPNKAVM